MMYCFLATLVAMCLYTQQILPVFHGLQGLSVNKVSVIPTDDTILISEYSKDNILQYFEKRFDRRLQMLGSVLFVIVTVRTFPRI